MAVLPPAPNWFSAQILRSSDDGHVAFGAKNSVVVLQCKPKAHFVGEKETCDNPEITHSKADGKLLRRLPYTVHLVSSEPNSDPQ